LTCFPSSLTKGLDGLGDVFDMLGAHRLESESKLLLDFLGDFGGDTNATGVCELFESCGYVHALAKAVVTVNDHFAEINADTHPKALIFGQIGIALGEAALQAHGAFDCIDHGAEFGEHAVAHRLENSSVMPRDFRLEQLFAPRRQPLVSSPLVALHERGVPDHICGEDDGELAFHAPSLPGKRTRSQTPKVYTRKQERKLRLGRSDRRARRTRARVCRTAGN
jgi:hypothetical protein